MTPSRSHGISPGIKTDPDFDGQERDVYPAGETREFGLINPSSALKGIFRKIQFF